MKKTIVCLAALFAISSAYAQPQGGGAPGGMPAGGAGGARPNAAPQGMPKGGGRPEMARPNGGMQPGGMPQGKMDRPMENRMGENRMGMSNPGERREGRMERRQDRMDGRMEGGPRGEMNRGGEMRQDTVGRPEMKNDKMMPPMAPEQRERMEKRREAFRNLPSDKKEAVRDERQRHREEMRNIMGNPQEGGQRAPQNPGAPDSQPAQQQ